MSNCISSLISLVLMAFCAESIAAPTGFLNDTGQSSNFDGLHGRDAAFSAGLLTKQGGGGAGFDYTKLGASGLPLSIQGGIWGYLESGGHYYDSGNEIAGTKWSCVLDNVTDLIWEIKSSSYPPALQDNNWEYTWFDGINGTPAGSIYGTRNCFTEGRCDTNKYIEDINALGLCGRHDWRLPTRRELLSLVNHQLGLVNESVIPYFPYFPNTWDSYFSDDYFSGISNKWVVNLLSGTSSTSGSGAVSKVILVSGGRGPAHSFRNNDDGTVTDLITGLTWDRCVWGRSGEDCSIGNQIYKNYSEALNLPDLANLNKCKGYEDWRLPNRTELESLVNLYKTGYGVPLIDSSFFPNTPADYYAWSSTENKDFYARGDYAWSISFASGVIYSEWKSRGLEVRLVRGGRAFSNYMSGKEPLVPSVSISSKGYDGTRSAYVTSCELAGVISSDQVTCNHEKSFALFSDAQIGTQKPVTVYNLRLGGPDSNRYSLVSTTTATTANITGASAEVYLSNLTQAYTGSSLGPTATTFPSGLNVTWTGAPQTNAGSYPVTATVNEQNYQGSASGTFIINQASQAALVLQAGSTAIFEGTSTTLSAQGGSNLGTVSYSAQATNGLTCAISGNQLTATGSAGTCTVTATRAGDGNYLPVSSSPLAITVTLPQRQLVVSKAGSGAVYSSPSGISCGSVCSAYYDKYTPVTLTAEPASGQYFVAWSGACLGLGSCTVNMTDNRSVTATFAVIPQNGFSLTVSKTGNGTISSLSPNASINCGINCQSNFAAGQLVTLFAQPDRGHTFMGWSGQAAGLCGRQTSCDVYMSSNQSISGEFKNTYLLILPAIQLLLE